MTHMKKLFLSLTFLTATVLSGKLMAQQEATEITKKNSWLKLGLTAGVPVGDISDASSFTLGLDVKGQLMTTPHWGIGLTSGYNHFFAKNGGSDFGEVPLGAFVRYYAHPEGFFIGTDLGYGFLTGSASNANGGFYLRPQLGYHNYSWNFFAFYHNNFVSDPGIDNFQYVGVGATYNIHFK